MTTSARSGLRTADRRRSLSVYTDTAGGYGGAEYSAVMLAAAGSRRYETVDLWHHWTASGSKDWERILGEPLPENLRLRSMPREEVVLWPFERGLDGPSRWKQPLDWRKERSRGYAAFVHFGHRPPPYCRARRGVFFVHFPLDKPYTRWPLHVDGPLDLRSRVRRRIAERYWLGRFGTYARGYSNSAFTAHCVADRWGAATSVLHPPPRPPRQRTPVAKERLILAVGRFTPRPVYKAGLELVRAFGASALPSAGIRLVVAGGLFDRDGDPEYFRMIQATAGHGVEVMANPDADTMQRLFERASVYWHAAGLGVDVTREPEKAEHFGLSVVEAMQAGAVPVVIGVGGPAEVVVHAESGLLCASLDEIVSYTRQLFENHTRLATMRDAAVERSRAFSAERFAATVLDELGGGA